MPAESVVPMTNLNKPAKAAHVNMMQDTIIANLSLEGLRSVLRNLLGVDPSLSSQLNAFAAQYLDETRPLSVPVLFHDNPFPAATPAFYQAQRRYRCYMGCGMGFESMKRLQMVLNQVQLIRWKGEEDSRESLANILTIVDADVVQAATAVQKELLSSNGQRDMTSAEFGIIQNLHTTLLSCEKQSQLNGQDFAFERGLARIEKFEGLAISQPSQEEVKLVCPRLTDNVLEIAANTSVETFQLGTTALPRVFMGLWQFSSPAWGTATRTKIHQDFRKHVDAGFRAYDMADHYGDAEVTFGQFRSTRPDSDNIFCATKYCVFEPVVLTEEVVKASVTERLTNINSEKIDLLQLHWQFYDDHQYIKMAQLVERDTRVSNVGLCNFDTQRMDEILESGAKIVSNQVQFSLIDLRPIFQMADSCLRHNVKLLTYGSLCGGFLADKWLNKPAPSLYGDDMTPSHRKYFEMINVWGGWLLFQELLQLLASIGKKYNATISNVASRWVLDHEYVGAIIIGARMGISEHVEENLKVFTFKLNQEDKSAIQAILDRSRARDVFEAMGDCGAEYRH